MAFASLTPLRHRSFAIAITSSFVSSVGTWMQSVALGIYLTETTRNPLWLGLLTVSAWTPAIIGAPIGGVVADRWSRQRWIQLNNLIMAGTASALAVAALTHHLSPALACYLAIGEGLCGSASWAAWQSLLPDLVDRDEVLAAVSLSSAQFNLGRIIGPVFASVALVLGSVGLCFLANALSFIFVLIVFSFVRTPAREVPTTKVRFVAETVAGARRAWQVKGCRNPILGVGAVGIVASPFIALVPAMAIIALHAGKIGTTWLVTAQGVGAVAAALTLPIIAKRTSRLAVLRGAMFALAFSLVIYALSPTLIVSALAMVVVGGAYMGTLTGLNTSVQVHAPLAERSRILALYTLSLSVFYPLGAFVQADLARAVGVRTVTLVGALVLALALGTAVLARPQFWRDMGSPVEPPLLLAD
ncbi:MAG TPA: MFS transporter [Acidimicrobiales bacterium]|nr:MFS transporter [Acidimicrobiales bacterium]